MKVAWLCPYPLSRLKALDGRVRAGAEHASTWIVTLADALVQSQADVELHVVTESTRVWRNVEVKQDGITFHVLRSESCVPFTRRGWPAFLPLDVCGGFSSNVREMRDALQRIKPDLVHGHGTERAYGLAAVRSGFPSIVSIQGIVNEIYKDKPGRMWATLRDLERQCLREGRHFIAKTPFVRAFAESQRADAVIYDIPNPVHPAFLRVERQRASGKRAIFVGSLLPEKGVEDLLAAAAQIPGLELCMIGAGSASYAAGLREQGRGMKVEWLGAVPVERVAEEMARSDVLVLPSHMETSPNVVAEAMCAGLPVVATRVGGVPAMVEHGVTGQLVAPRDDVALAQALRQTFENPDRAGAMAERARKLAKERHGADVAVRATLSAYERVLQ